jgi:broad specificity phosphatase PhoE
MEMLKPKAIQKSIIIWLVRHGETFANLQKIIQGQQGGELTDKGHD